MASTIVAYERLHRKLKWTSIISEDFRRELLESVYEGYREGLEDGERKIRDKEDIDEQIARKKEDLKEARGREL